MREASIVKIRIRNQFDLGLGIDTRIGTWHELGQIDAYIYIRIKCKVETAIKLEQLQS